MTRSIIYSGEHQFYPHVWEMHELREDGTKGLVVLPKTTLDWRAAEYGIDPTDVDTLLDIILHERYVPTQQDELRDPALKAKALPWLLEAENTAEARKHHMARIRRARYQFKVKGESVYDPIRSGHTPNHDLIAQARQMVDLGRWHAKYGDLPQPKKQRQQFQATPFIQTGIKEKSQNSVPDSMMIVGSTTITAKGQ